MNYAAARIATQGAHVMRIGSLRGTRAAVTGGPFACVGGECSKS